jgi:hypothetical protein
MKKKLSTLIVAGSLFIGAMPLHGRLLHYLSPEDSVSFVRAMPAAEDDEKDKSPQPKLDTNVLSQEKPGDEPDPSKTK